MTEPDPPRLVVLSGLPGPSGGTVYNTRLAREWGVTPVPVTGPWPQPGPDDLTTLRRVLLGGPREQTLVVDGMLASAAPQVVREAVVDGRTVWVLVHLPLPAETGLAPAQQCRLEASERAALAAATGVVVTSEWAATDLRRRYDVNPVVVAPPGTDPADAAVGSTPARLLTVASFTPRKNHRLLVDALTRVRDLPWTAHWVGTSGEHDTTGELRRQLAGAGLGDRVRLEGPRTGQALEAAWAQADLLLLPSLAETYAMVVGEALVREVPALVSAGTAAEQTLAGPAAERTLPGPVTEQHPAGRDTAPGAFGAAPDLAGAALDPHAPQAWAQTLFGWLGDQALRDRWRASARRRGAELPRWADTAAALRRDIGGCHPASAESGTPR